MSKPEDNFDASVAAMVDALKSVAKFYKDIAREALKKLGQRA